MTDLELLEGFESATLPAGTFRHREHVRVAWLLLRSASDLLEALVRFRAGLVRYAESLGKRGVYHETVTWTYMILIHERMLRSGATSSSEDFARDNADLLAWKPSVLDAYYSPELLASERARRTFVLPDRAPPMRGA